MKMLIDRANRTKQLEDADSGNKAESRGDDGDDKAEKESSEVIEADEKNRNDSSAGRRQRDWQGCQCAPAPCDNRGDGPGDQAHATPNGEEEENESGARLGGH